MILNLDLHPTLAVEAEWVGAAAEARKRLAAGAPAVCRIRSATAKPKWVTYSLRKLSNDSWELLNCSNGKAYVVTADLASCDCGDAMYRLRENLRCKHRSGLSELLKEAGVAP